MNWLFWNCCGAGKDGFPRNVRYLSTHFRVSMLAIFEQQISGNRSLSISKSLGFNQCVRVEAIGRAGGIWLLWKSDRISVAVVACYTDFIHAVVTNISQPPINVFFVYGPPTPSRSVSFWEDLDRAILPITSPVFVGGDFN